MNHPHPSIDRTPAEGVPQYHLAPCTRRGFKPNLHRDGPVEDQKTQNEPNPTRQTTRKRKTNPIRACHAGRRSVPARRETQFHPAQQPKIQNEPNFHPGHDPKNAKRTQSVGPPPSGRPNHPELYENEPNFRPQQTCGRPKKRNEPNSRPVQHPNSRNEPNLSAAQDQNMRNERNKDNARCNRAAPIFNPHGSGGSAHDTKICETNPIYPCPSPAHETNARNEPNSRTPKLRLTLYAQTA